jgi:hypothetical protein
MLCKLHVNKNNKRSKFAFTGKFRFQTVGLPIGKASGILNDRPDGLAWKPIQLYLTPGGI